MGTLVIIIEWASFALRVFGFAKTAEALLGYGKPADPVQLAEAENVKKKQLADAATPDRPIGNVLDELSDGPK